MCVCVCLSCLATTSFLAICGASYWNYVIVEQINCCCCCRWNFFKILLSLTARSALPFPLNQDFRHCDWYVAQWVALIFGSFVKGSKKCQKCVKNLGLVEMVVRVMLLFPEETCTQRKPNQIKPQSHVSNVGYSHHNNSNRPQMQHVVVIQAAENTVKPILALTSLMD